MYTLLILLPTLGVLLGLALATATARQLRRDLLGEARSLVERLDATASRVTDLEAWLVEISAQLKTKGDGVRDSSSPPVIERPQEMVEVHSDHGQFWCRLHGASLEQHAEAYRRMQADIADKPELDTPRDRTLVYLRHLAVITLDAPAQEEAHPTVTTDKDCRTAYDMVNAIDQEQLKAVYETLAKRFGWDKHEKPVAALGEGLRRSELAWRSKFKKQEEEAGVSADPQPVEERPRPDFDWVRGLVAEMPQDEKPPVDDATA